MPKSTVNALLWLVLPTVAACARPTMPVVDTVNLTLEQIPANIRELVAETDPDFTIIEVQKKVRDGRTYYDVEGLRADGHELEFDIMITSTGPVIIEIQQDIDWNDAPVGVRTAANDVSPGLAPVRVIESRQTDGSIIFELFAPGAPSDPAMEVQWSDGLATVLSERWPH